MYRLFILLFALLCSLWVKAQEMSLEECIDYAIGNNISLSTQKMKVEIAEEEYRQSKRNLLPLVEAGISGSQLFGRSIDPKTNAYIDKGSIFSSNMYLSGQIRLFEGFARQNTIRYKKLQRLMSSEDVSQSQMEIAFQVMNSYYDVVYYINLLSIADEQVALTRLNLKNTEKLIEIGLKAEADLLEMQAQEASELHNRLTVKNKMEKALLTLKKLMNFPIEKPLSIPADPVVTFCENIPGIDSIYGVALGHMPLVQKAKLDVKAHRKNLAISRGNLYPSLSVGGNFSSSYADSWKEQIDPNDEALGYRTVGFKDQVSENISKRVFVQMSIPIFQRWESRSKIKTAKRRLAIARNERENAERNLLQEISEDYQQLEALGKERNQLQIKAKAMNEAYKIAEKKLEQGLISILEFYTAKNQLANTQAELLRTKLQLKIKEKTMDFYLGRNN